MRHVLARATASVAAAGLLAVGVHAGPAGAAEPPTELFISEYVEGTSNNKAIEIYNPTGAAVDLAAGDYRVSASKGMFVTLAYGQRRPNESGTPVTVKDGQSQIGINLALPRGGVIAGVVMSRWGKLTTLMRSGAILMVVGNALVTSLGFEDSKWKYFVYVFPANLGQGIIYPAILFTSLASFDHAGKPAPNRLSI